MKRLLPILCCCLLLVGCARSEGETALVSINVGKATVTCFTSVSPFT